MSQPLGLFSGRPVTRSPCFVNRDCAQNASLLPAHGWGGFRNLNLHLERLSLRLRTYNLGSELDSSRAKGRATMAASPRIGRACALALAAVLAALLVALQWYSPHVQLCRPPMNQVLIAKQVPAARQVPACATALSF